MASDTVKKQIELIENIIVIGKKILTDIDNLGSITLLDDKKDLENAIILNYQKLYIENFFNFADFLLEKIKTDEKHNFNYYVPSLRIFMEVYIDLLFLVNQPTERRAILCVSNHLFILAKYIQCGSNKLMSNSDELTLLYEDELNQSNIIIKDIGIPQNPQKLSKKFMTNNNLYFPTKKSIIRDYFDNSSVITRSIFGIPTSDDFYETYRTLSDYVHGSVFSIMKKDNPTANEQFWLIIRLQMFSMLIIELANQKVIGNNRINEFNKWIDDFKENKTEFVNYWMSIKNKTL